MLPRERETVDVPPSEGNDLRVIRSKLLNLVLDWELEALALDAKRYKSELPEQRESLKHDALLYRKCIAEVTEVLGTVSSMKHNFK